MVLSALLLWPLTLYGGEWSCHGILRPGDLDLTFELHLDRDTKTARLILPETSWTVSPITSERQGHYFYDLLPGVEDERVETRRMFRFGKEQDLVYIDNDEGVFLLGRCTDK
ncbi:MAG: hypothetical protein HUJ31_10375 [Pseudomonadales bacterium]|nr:hypothetical protein [Pseudomonadales bacterium]